ncbi:hypothetical protein T492DRAFT_526696 [Pavlovales sp. CCMP2436]|nr:hypothetical protein T492DRAFT_526696 [Pavlovales sp. CCMP2436]
MEWCTYVWPTPRCARKVLVCSAGAAGGRGCMSGGAEYPLEGLTDFRPCEIAGGLKLFAHVHARGATRVLTLADRPGPGAERGLTLHDVPLSLSLKLAGAGLTVLDGTRELLYGCALGVEGALALSPLLQRLELKVRAVQLDNLLPSAKHPVLLRLDEGGGGGGSGAVPPSESAESCFVYLQVVRRDAGFFHLLELLPPTVKLVLDVAVLEAAARAVLASTSDGISGDGGGFGREGSGVSSLERSRAASAAVREALEVEAAESLPPPQLEGFSLVGSGATPMVYVETLHLGRLGANVTAIVELDGGKGCKAGVAHRPSSAEAEAAASGLAAGVSRVARRLPVPKVLTRLVHSAIRTLGGLAGALGASLASVSDVHFRFSELLLRKAFTGEGQLLTKLLSHYGRQGVTQLGKALGCSDVLGNPLGLLDSVGSGVFEFVRDGVGGIVAGDAQQVGGAAKALVRGVIGGATGSTAKITGSLERLVRGATGNQRRPADEGERADLLRDVQRLGQGLLTPMAGMGSEGNLLSFTRGVAGVVALPVVGTLMVTTELLRSVHEHVQFDQPRRGLDARVRPPRLVADCAPLRPLGKCMLSHVCLRVTGAAYGGPVPSTVSEQSGQMVCVVLVGAEQRLRFACELSEWPDGMRWPSPLLLKVRDLAQTITLQLRHESGGTRRGGISVGERTLHLAEARELCVEAARVQADGEGGARSRSHIWLALTQPGALASAYLQVHLAMCDGTRDPVAWAAACVVAMGDGAPQPPRVTPDGDGARRGGADAAALAPRRVSVSVAAHRVERDGWASRHTCYVLVVALGEERWEVARRFSDFRALYDALAGAFPSSVAGATAQMPRRELLPGLRDKELEASRRMPALQQYLQWLLLDEDTRGSEQLMVFLDRRLSYGRGGQQLVLRRAWDDIY